MDFNQLRNRFNFTFLSSRLGIQVLIFCIGFSLAHCQWQKSSESSSISSIQQNPSLASKHSQHLEWIKIKETVWIHRSFGEFQGQVYSANGLVVLSNKGAVVIDTPWTESQTEELFSEIKTKFQKEILFLLVTHAHDDRMAGVPLFHKRNIPVYSTALTAKLAKERGLGKTNPILDIQTRLPAGNQSVEVFYPGQGHSADNIVVWLPETHILFGGCLVKALDAKDLGNVKEADLNEWPNSVKRVLSRYTDAEVVVPGHGDWGKLDLLRHTIRLLVSPNH
ncbi:subclass B1 metallo-beta-lactamase [Leptospira sp. 2 VSF19]|uniref:beta-lactamase n=1 Tax=Leptospira soteropolitanensis TaxID=2950025 RepID=A0AAW5VN85_9LEPT|nr:subclass B1 metallo-beta-lactamase [Leptospira soteropolitanensis]MCW7493904.1 subclass B1 metallo-beta-lactamase [Leptospira soteropolitanensis]MCW7501498.1 subclass B1 metallo-beta-lactamase [Leptospira soteropolitanensis]MCW7523739.1 subclass B1 metallo-beta-lactamase [Leptospira soteropolitanensis]MCW7527603.1 subclass B1 metallo-beta-lactamase [Leptospira soteropolitanensis]MCW7531457.1 subclass B1 metallo-beta-lactamase [Leptospira soteropolitanensis]